MGGGGERDIRYREKGLDGISIRICLFIYDEPHTEVFHFSRSSERLRDFSTLTVFEWSLG